MTPDTLAPWIIIAVVVALVGMMRNRRRTRDRDAEVIADALRRSDRRP